MAEITYSSGIGISEAAVRTLNKAKKIIGTVDNEGDNIGVVDIQSRIFNKLPMFIMIIFLVPVLLGYFFQTPLSWIPVDSNPGSTWHEVKNWQMFSTWSWILAVITYLLFAFCVLLKNNLYSGVEGAYIVFMRYGKIVKILSPGQFWVNFDWRINPEFVVSSKIFTLGMPEVRGKEKSNHTMYHSGSLIGVISSPEDAHKLISKGGFKNLLKALNAIYITSVKDLFKATEADSFNTFLIEPIQNAVALKDDSRELDEISKQNLSIRLIEDLSRIDDVDVSLIELSEVGGIRDVILPMLKAVAEEYGIDLKDYVPLGNNVSNDFLSTKVIKLVTILERLKQAADNLYDIIAEEWDEDIQSAVAGKKVGALEIKRLIDEMASLMRTMVDEDNIQNIFDQKSEAIGNIMEGHIGSILTAIETLQNKVTSKTVDMTGLELYVTELEAFIGSLDSDDSITALVPQIDGVWVSEMDEASLLPSVDAVDKMLKTTGMKSALDKLKGGLDAGDGKEQDFEAIQKEVDGIHEDAEKIGIEEVLADLQKKMDSVTGDAGIDISSFKWEKVKERIADIKQDAGVEDDEEEPDE